MDEKQSQETRVGEGQIKATMKLDPTTKLVLGREIGGYLIKSELGRGGMAMVYRAHDKQLDRTVAIKVLPLHMASDEEFANRFEREAKAAAKLDHPNVVNIYAAGRSEEILFIAMQFVEGSSLSDILHDRRVGMREALDIVRQTALALDAAHQLGIVHRDIKPSNIMVQADGKVKVMDFGLAKAGRSGSAITQTGTYLGTPEYSSPEQCETRDVDGRSDVYSLGVVLYEMLSGTLPHVAETPLSLFKKIVEERPIPVEELNRHVPKTVRQLLERMLEKNPAKRCQSAADVAAAAERILKTERLPEASKDGVAAKDLPVISGRIPVGRKRQSRRIAGVAGLALAGAGILLSAMYLVKDPGQTPGGGGNGTIEPVAVKTPDPVGTTPVATVTTEQGQVIVFDFKNGNPKAPDAAEHEWLEIGITEMVIANLSQHANVKVMLRDDLVHEMNQLLRKKVSMGGDEPGESGARVNLTEETRTLVIKLDARWLLSGVFYVQERTKLRIQAQLHWIGDDQKLVARGNFVKMGEVAAAFTLVDELSAEILAKLVPVSKDAVAWGDKGAPAPGSAPAPTAGASGTTPRQPQESLVQAENAEPAKDPGHVGCENVVLNDFQTKNRAAYGIVSQSARQEADAALDEVRRRGRTNAGAEGGASVNKPKGGRKTETGATATTSGKGGGFIAPETPEVPDAQAGAGGGEAAVREPAAAVAGGGQTLRGANKEKTDTRKGGELAQDDKEKDRLAKLDQADDELGRKKVDEAKQTVAVALGADAEPGGEGSSHGFAGPGKTGVDSPAEGQTATSAAATTAGAAGAGAETDGPTPTGAEDGLETASQEYAGRDLKAPATRPDGGQTPGDAEETLAENTRTKELEKQIAELVESNDKIVVRQRHLELQQKRQQAKLRLRDGIAALAKLAEERGGLVPQDLADQLAQFRCRMEAQVAQGEGANTATGQLDKIEKMRIFWTVQKQIEDLTPGDVQAISTNKTRLHGIFGDAKPVEQILAELETMFVEVAAQSQAAAGRTGAVPADAKGGDDKAKDDGATPTTQPPAETK